jgi:hypothetical protein
LVVRPLRARIKVALVAEVVPEFIDFVLPEVTDVGQSIKKRVWIAINTISQRTHFVNEDVADGAASF